MSVKESPSGSTRVTVKGDFSIAVPKGMVYSTDPDDLSRGFAVTIMKTERNAYFDENCADDVHYDLASPASAPQCLAIAVPSRMWKDEIPGYDSTDPGNVRQALALAEPIIGRLYLSLNLMEGRICARECQRIKQEDDFYVARIANADGSIGRVTDFCVVTAEALYQGQLVINDTDQENEMEETANRWLSSVCSVRKTKVAPRAPQVTPKEQEADVVDRTAEAAHAVLVSDSDNTRVTVHNDFTVAVPKGMRYSTDPDQIFNDSAVVIMKTERNQSYDERFGDDAAYDMLSPGSAPRCLAIATPTMVWKDTIPEYDSTDPACYRQIIDQGETMLRQYRDKLRFGGLSLYRVIKQEEDIFVGSLEADQEKTDFIVITPEGFYQGQLVVHDVDGGSEITEVVDTWLRSIRRKAAPSPKKKAPAKAEETKKTAAKKSATKKPAEEAAVETKKSTAKKSAATETGETKKSAAKKPTAEKTEEPKKTTARKPSAAKTGEAKKPAAKKRTPAQPKVTKVNGTSTAIGETVWIEGDTLRVSAAFDGVISILSVQDKFVTEMPIKRIVFEDGWETIKWWPRLFHQLERVELPNTVKRFEEGAFQGVQHLQRIEIPPLVEAIPRDFMWFLNTFHHSELREIVFRGNLVKSIGQRAFNGNDCLLELTLPDGLRDVGESAFSMCHFLQVVLLPSTLEKIGSSAFSGDQQLRYVQIPASVTDIAPDAFQYCPNVCFLVTPGSAAERYAQEKKLPCKYAQYGSTQQLLRDVGYTLGQPRFIEDENGNCVAASTLTDEEDDRTILASIGSECSWNDHTWVTVNRDFSIRIPDGYMFSTDPKEILEHRALVFIDTCPNDVYKKIMGENYEDFSLAAPFSAPRAFVLQTCASWPVDISSFDGSAGPYGPCIRSTLNDTLLGPPDSPCIDVIDQNDLIVRYRRNSEGLLDGQEQVFFIIATLQGAYFGQIWINDTEDPAVRYKTVERWLRGIHTGPCKKADSKQPASAPVAAAPASYAPIPATPPQPAAPSLGAADDQEATPSRRERLNALYMERDHQQAVIQAYRFSLFGVKAVLKKAAKRRLAEIEEEIEELTESE